MGKRPKKKIVLFLVEGTSDRNALEIPFGQLLDDIDSDIILEFAVVIQDSGAMGGDITSKYGIHPDNIARFIDELIVEPFLKCTGLYPKDLFEIVHFIDMDGAYIDESKVFASGTSSDKPVYYDDHIVTGNPEYVRERNKRKADNINTLSAMSSVKIGSKTVKYSVYYFSSNLDHFLHGEANLDEHEKTGRAMEFSAVHQKSEDFVAFFRDNPYVAADMTYEESWEYIKKGDNSLGRFSNVNLLIERLFATKKND